jgi:hypothetical protein
MGGKLRELALAFSTHVVRELSKPYPALWLRERVVSVAELVEDGVSLSCSGMRG